MVVWGTGNIGKPALRTVVSNPQLELAAVVVANPDRVGLDAGDICGTGRLGVRIKGRPNIELSIESEDERGDRAGGGNTTAAARVVNSIPFVCEAAPGLLDALSAPLQPGRGLLRAGG